MQGFREWWQKLPDKTKKQLTVLLIGTIAVAAVIVVALNLNKDAGGYSTLFTGLNQEEAQQVVSLLQEEGITYRYGKDNGSISVPSSTVDQTRAELLSKGYPKSGFSYDMYRDNAGLMSTESDKKQYTIYELQDRLGAQIRLFDGVQDAKVTIAYAEEAKYALGDSGQAEASAAVTVTMQDGRTLSENGAEAIKRLITTSVRGMNFTNVSVFDAVTMTEVAGSGDGGSAFGSTKDLTSLTSLIENNIAINVRRVLEKLYGQGSVAVSVKGTLNMERLIQENTQYSTPEKIDEEDKTGLLAWEGLSSENSNAADPGAGGVVGADANADVPRYTNRTGADALADSYANSSATREWLYNSVKEQRQIDPGVLENTTVGVVIDTNDNSVPEMDLRRLVANAAGIPVEDATSKITIIRALSPESKVALQQEEEKEVVAPPIDEDAGFPWPLLIAAIAGGVLLLLLLLLLLLRRKRKKKAGSFPEGVSPPVQEEASGEDWSEDEFPGFSGKAPVSPMQLEEDEEMSQNEEIIRLKMQRNLKLKQNIGEIVDENPQIVAKLVQGWLNEEGDNNGGGRGSDRQRRK